MSQIPQRMCAACRVHADKDDFFRFVRDTDGTLLWDAGMKMPGRGAYLCKKEDCIRKAVKTRVLTRNLHAQSSDTFYEELLQSIHG